ncbi:retrovirus-related pol polyprotein from transposon TNT 1-94 [Tanacetum coccineum]
MDENRMVVRNKERIFLAYAAYIGFVVYQIDVKSAFLNGKLSKEEYVQQPYRFESSEFPNHVCKLDKDLYGLKQAPRAWYETLSKFLIQHKFVRGKLVCWSAKKQNSVAMSSAKAEYVAAVGYHFIRDHILKGDIELHFVPNDLQLADIFTKPPLVAKLVTPASNVKFECDKGIIAFNNGIALLEYSNPLYLPMLTFLSRCCVSTALTKQISACDYEYLRELWYSAKVDATNIITFTISSFDKPLSFNLDDFSSITALKYSENYVSLPPKETVRAGLASLRLVDEKNPNLSLNNLVNSSPLKIRYFSPIWRVLMLHIVKCLGGMQGSHDKLNINYHFFQTSSASKAALFPHMLKKANISTVVEQTLILLSKEVNASNIVDMSLSGTTVQPVDHPKSSTDKRSKKRKTLSSSKPKTSKNVKQSK